MQAKQPGRLATVRKMIAELVDHDLRCKAGPAKGARQTGCRRRGDHRWLCPVAPAGEFLAHCSPPEQLCAGHFQLVVVFFADFFSVVRIRCHRIGNDHLINHHL
ncbi:MAG: hypothetical protein O3C21_13650 [Verrucomicrobia bacterium]|nr:hypothetical protein [Verrucomicrobiota bacterium]